jgi:hypothetical protein
MKLHNCEVVSEKRTIMMSAEWRVNSLSLSVFPMHTTEALHKAKPGLLKRMFVCMRFTEKNTRLVLLQSSRSDLFLLVLAVFLLTYLFI